MERSFTRPENPEGVNSFDFAKELGHLVQRYAGSSLESLGQLVEMYSSGNHQHLALEHIGGRTVAELAELHGVTRGDIVSRLRTVLAEVASEANKKEQPTTYTGSQTSYGYNAAAGESTGDWRDKAECGTSDPELFFPVGNTGPAADQIDRAKAVCGRCAVTDFCLQYALETSQDSGVWGGMSEDERRALKRRQARERRS